MARIIPDIENLAEIEHSSEATIYGALRDQLGDEFTVLHSYPWLRPWRGEGALLEGEADFVILHQTLGVLVLEVKEERESSRINKGGSERLKRVRRSFKTLSYRPVRTFMPW